MNTALRALPVLLETTTETAYTRDAVCDDPRARVNEVQFKGNRMFWVVVRESLRIDVRGCSNAALSKGVALARLRHNYVPQDSGQGRLFR